MVDGDSYLLELTRYVVLNPVRAGMVELPGDWRWSSYLDMLGARSAPHWLAIDGLLAQFAHERQEAVRYYVQFAELTSKYRNRNDAIVAAYATGAYSYQQIADFYELHFTTVGKILCKARALQ